MNSSNTQHNTAAEPIESSWRPAIDDLINGRPVPTEKAIDAVIRVGRASHRDVVLNAPSREQVARCCEQALASGQRGLVARRSAELMDAVCHPLATLEGDMTGWHDDRPTVAFASMLAEHNLLSNGMMLAVERQLEMNTFLTEPNDYLAQMEAVNQFISNDHLALDDVPAMHRRMTRLASLGKGFEANDPERIIKPGTVASKAMGALRSFERHLGLTPIIGPFLESRHEIQVVDDQLARAVSQSARDNLDETLLDNEINDDRRFSPGMGATL